MTLRDEPHFLLEVAVQPATASRYDDFVAALKRMAESDPSFRSSTDAESGQTILAGASEEHLAQKIEELRSHYKIEIQVGAPQVAYRETVSRAVTVTHTHKRLNRGLGQFAGVTILFEPMLPGSGYVFENRAMDGSLPKEFSEAVEKGLLAQKEIGLLAGFPVIDFKASLLEGKYHEVDSNELTVNIAARAAFRELARENAIVLLEPIMKVEVTTPEDFLGGVIADISARKGVVAGTGAGNGDQVVEAQVPLSNLFGYRNSLNVMTHRRGSFTMQFSHYDRVPNGTSPDDSFPMAAAMRVA
jgi:elongation factor G